MNRRINKYYFSLLHVDYVKLDRRWNYNNVISPYYRLYYIDRGEGQLSNIDGYVKLEPGYLYLIPSFTLFNMKCEGYLSQYFVQFFEESAEGISLFVENRSLMKCLATETDILNFRRLVEINPNRGINRSDNPRVYEKDIFYKEYQALNKLQSLAVHIETQGIIYQLMSRFLAVSANRQYTVDIIPSKVLDTISFIELNLDKLLNVSMLAARVHQNEDHFSRVFQKYTGDRPVTYIRYKRIERAQYLITTTNMPYAIVAEKTGFKNLPYFWNVFKKITGMTPDAYRRQNRAMDA